MFLRKDVWKYAANLQENTHAEVQTDIYSFYRQYVQKNENNTLV